MILRIIISLLIGLGCGIGAYFCLDESQEDKLIFLKKYDKKDLYNLSVNRNIAIILSCVIFVLCGFLTFKIYGDSLDILNFIKMMVLLFALLLSGAVDLRKHIIPNLFILITIIIAVILLLVAIVVGQDGAYTYIVTNIGTAVVSVIALVIGSLLSHHGVGAGDIKLIFAVALLGGVYITCGILFFGIIMCAATSLVLLLFKKIKKTGSLPFGPFLFVGYILTVILYKY